MVKAKLQTYQSRKSFNYKEWFRFLSAYAYSWISFFPIILVFKNREGGERERKRERGWFPCIRRFPSVLTGVFLRVAVWPGSSKAMSTNESKTMSPKPKYQFFFKSQCLHDQTGMVSANDHTHHRGVLTSQGDLPCALQILGTFRNSNTELAMDCVLKDTFTKKQC